LKYLLSYPAFFIALHIEEGAGGISADFRGNYSVEKHAPQNKK
jgi:hypothetical protein